MRVTDRMLYDRATRDGGAARTRLEEATARASTGLKLSHPKDDPAGAGLVAQHRAMADRLDAIATVTQRATDELSAVDGALGEAGNAIARAREIAVRLGSATYTAADRAVGATEVKGLVDSLIAALNVQSSGRYVLAGTADATQPFDPTGVPPGAYRGNTGVRQVEIAPGVLQDVSVRGDVAMNGAGGGVDVFQALADLQAALAANDQAATTGTLDRLAAATAQVANVRSQVGVQMNALDTAHFANLAARDEATTQASRLTDADAIQAASDLALAQRALEASLTATAQSFRMSLLDYLK